MRQCGWQQNVNNQNITRIVFFLPCSSFWGQWSGPRRTEWSELGPAVCRHHPEPTRTGTSLQSDQQTRTSSAAGGPADLHLDAPERGKKVNASYNQHQNVRNGRLTRPWLLSLKRVKSWLEVSKRVLQISSNHSRRGPPQSSAAKNHQH